jgi:hypothetical protein
MTPTGVRTGLATAIDSIAGLRCFDYVPDAVSPPAAVIEPIEVNYGVAMQDGLDQYQAYILVIVGRMSERSAQDRLDAYVTSSGASSIKAKVEADPTLGGACSTLQVTDANPRTVTVSGVEMIAYRFGVEIYG